MGDTPEPEIIIRTGGHKRLSNFLLFYAAYSEIYFLDCMWPDLNEVNCKKLLQLHSNRRGMLVYEACMCLGEGAWGTAVATLLAHNGHAVKLWCYEAANAQTIARTRINERYLPGHILSERITPTASFEDAMRGSDGYLKQFPCNIYARLFKKRRHV